MTTETDAMILRLIQGAALRYLATGDRPIHVQQAAYQAFEEALSELGPLMAHDRPWLPIGGPIRAPGTR